MMICRALLQDLSTPVSVGPPRNSPSAFARKVTVVKMTCALQRGHWSCSKMSWTMQAVSRLMIFGHSMCMGNVCCNTITRLSGRNTYSVQSVLTADAPEAASRDATCRNPDLIRQRPDHLYLVSLYLSSSSWERWTDQRSPSRCRRPVAPLRLCWQGFTRPTALRPALDQMALGLDGCSLRNLPSVPLMQSARFL